MEFAKILARNPSLTLSEIILLDKVQKKKELTDNEIKLLKEQKLIEGRKPNFHIAEGIASKTGQIDTYIKNKGLNTTFYKSLIKELLDKNPHGCSKNQIRQLLWDKLPNILTKKQKENRISNLLTSLKKERKIENVGSDSQPRWKSL